MTVNSPKAANLRAINSKYAGTGRQVVLKQP